METALRDGCGAAPWSQGPSSPCCLPLPEPGTAQTLARHLHFSGGNIPGALTMEGALARQCKHRAPGTGVVESEFYI